MASYYGDNIYQNSGKRVTYGDGYPDSRHLREKSGYGDSRDRDNRKSIEDPRNSYPSEYKTNLQSQPAYESNPKFGHTYRSNRISHVNQELNEGKNLSSKFLIYGGKESRTNENFHRDNSYYLNPQPSKSYFTHSPPENRDRLKDNLEPSPKDATESFWTIYQEDPKTTQTTCSNEGKFYPGRENHINRPENPHFYEELLRQYKNQEEQERISKPPHHRQDPPDRYDFPTTNNKSTERAPQSISHGWPSRWNDRRFSEMTRRFPPTSSHNFSPHQIKLNRCFPSNSSYNSGSRPSLMDWISSSSRNSLVDQMYLNSASKNSLSSQPKNGTNISTNSFLSPVNPQTWKNGPQQCHLNPTDPLAKYRDVTLSSSSKLDQHYLQKTSQDSPWGDSMDPSFRQTSQSLLSSPSTNGRRQIQLLNPTQNGPFPLHTSETHASFKNPLELSRKFRKNNHMEIPIIPGVTESQASYQNPHEPRKLPLGYPDKTTSHFVRSSIPSMRRDQRNNDEQQEQQQQPSFSPSLPPSRFLPDPQSNYSLNPSQAALIDYVRSRNELERGSYQPNNNNNYNNLSTTTVPASTPSQHYQGGGGESRGMEYSPRHDIINNSRDTSNFMLERKQNQDANHFSREPNTSSSMLHAPRNASGDCGNNTMDWYGKQNYFPRETSEKNFDRFNTSPHHPPPLMNSRRQEQEEDARKRFTQCRDSQERIYPPNDSTQRRSCENNHERSPGPFQYERVKQDEDRGSRNYSTSQVTTRQSLERHSENPPRTNISTRTNLSTKTTMNGAGPNCQKSPMGEHQQAEALKTSTGTGTRLIRHPELRPAEITSNRPLTGTPCRQRMSFRDKDDDSRSESSKPTKKKQVVRLRPILKQPRNQQNFNQSKTQSIEDSLKYVPLKIMLFCRKGIISIPSPSDVVPNSNSFSKTKELITLNRGSSHGAGDQKRHRFSVNMDGFLDEDIYIFMDRAKTKLIVEGRRPKRENINARRLVESIELPKGLSPDNLRVARDFKGILHFEEAWVF